MKKKLLCLLLALAVVMSVVPLTAFADGVPEEYRGTYEGTTERGDTVQFTISENQVIGFGRTFKLTGTNDCGDSIDYSFKSEIRDKINGIFENKYFTLFCKKGGKGISVRLDEVNYLNQWIYDVRKVSDPTNSTLSTGSDLIIPIAAAVLLIGAVIFIGKRKKEKEIQ